MHRVEIIGGGLAGLGLAIALRKQDVPVTVREAGHYPRHRVCGEFLTSLDKKTIEATDLGPILAGARHAKAVSWREEGRADMAHSLPSPAICISRRKLDHAMAERLVALGGDLSTGTRAKPTARPGSVLACGRHPAPSSPWVGLKQHFRRLPLHNDLEVHFARGGYIGLTAVDDETVNVCALLRRGSANFAKPLSVIAAEAGCAELSERLAAAAAVNDSLCAVAGLDYSHRPQSDGYLAVGDRAALLPPFTGHGMTIALQSAATVAPILRQWASGEVGWDHAVRAATRAQRQLFGLRLGAARLAHPFLLNARARRVAGGLHRLGLLPVGVLYRVLH